MQHSLNILIHSYIKKRDFRLLLILGMILYLAIISLVRQPPKVVNPDFQEQVARTHFIESIVGVRQEPAEMGEVLKAMFNDAAILKQSMRSQQNNPESFCYQLEIEKCSQKYVKQSLVDVEQMQPFSGKQAFALSYNEIVALKFLKVIKSDFAKYPRVGKEQIPINFEKVKSAYRGEKK